MYSLARSYDFISNFRDQDKNSNKIKERLIKINNENTLFGNSNNLTLVVYIGLLIMPPASSDDFPLNSLCPQGHSNRKFGFKVGDNAYID